MGDTSSRLMVAKCKGCGKIYNPPIYMCTACYGTEFEEAPLSGKGKILTTTTIRIPPLGFEDQVPYDVVIIQTEEGLHIPSRITNNEEENRSKIDDKVSFVKTEGGVHWFEIIR